MKIAVMLRGVLLVIVAVASTWAHGDEPQPGEGLDPAAGNPTNLKQLSMISDRNTFLNHKSSIGEREQGHLLQRTELQATNVTTGEVDGSDKARKYNQIVTTAPPTTIAPGPNTDCPTSQGFFKMSGPSSKCYMYDNSKRRTFPDAQLWCQSQGLRLAEVDDATSLRSYIVQRYGGFWTSNTNFNQYTWVNAQGDGTTFKWQISGVKISNRNALYWRSGLPVPATTSDCLVLLTNYADMNVEPGLTYFFRKCHLTYFTLCEMV